MILPDILNNTKAFSFIGVPSQQQYADLICWELFFNKILSAQPRPKLLVELGTGHGGLSLYFLLQAIQRDFWFETFDIVEPEVLGTRLAALLKLSVRFTKLDVFKNCRDVLENPAHPLILYCDNGDKPREVALYHKLLQSGDYLAVHDYNIEIFLEDIPDNCTGILWDECCLLNSITRFFRVT